MYTIISMLQSKIMAPTSDLDFMGIFSNRIQLGELNSYPHPVFPCLHFFSSAPFIVSVLSYNTYSRYWYIDIFLYRFISIYS